MLILEFLRLYVSLAAISPTSSSTAATARSAPRLFGTSGRRSLRPARGRRAPAPRRRELRITSGRTKAVTSILRRPARPSRPISSSFVSSGNSCREALETVARADLDDRDPLGEAHGVRVSGCAPPRAAMLRIRT